jgi:transcription elongation factor Elf1
VLRLGRRRRKVVKKKIIKPPPTVFICPLCDEESVSINYNKGDEIAIVRCMKCGAEEHIKMHPNYLPVDAYCEWYDRVIKRTTTINIEKT